MTDTQLRDVSTAKLLRACAYSEVSFNRGEKSIVGELERRKDLGVWALKKCTPLLPNFVTRGWLSAEVADAIDRGDLVVGMTKREMILSWGEPRKSNTDTGRWGVHTQHIYGIGAHMCTPRTAS